VNHIPNPGGKAAIAKGCTCPVLDNNHGSGFMVIGQRQFWMSEDCPLHNYAALTAANDAATVPSRDDSCD
jgi:hypothetical protein